MPAAKEDRRRGLAPPRQVCRPFGAAQSGASLSGGSRPRLRAYAPSGLIGGGEIKVPEAVAYARESSSKVPEGRQLFAGGVSLRNRPRKDHEPRRGERYLPPRQIGRPEGRRRGPQKGPARWRGSEVHCGMHFVRKGQAQQALRKFSTPRVCTLRALRVRGYCVVASRTGPRTRPRRAAVDGCSFGRESSSEVPEGRQLFAGGVSLRNRPPKDHEPRRGERCLPPRQIGRGGSRPLVGSAAPSGLIVGGAAFRGLAPPAKSLRPFGAGLATARPPGETDERCGADVREKASCAVLGAARYLPNAPLG